MKKEQKKTSSKKARHAAYGKELILDLHECDPKTFSRKSIRKYFEDVCILIDMERCKLTWWDDVGVSEDEKQTEPRLKGTSAFQFIMTSSIVIHTLDLIENVYINIFSCKDFNEKAAKEFSEKWFEGRVVNFKIIERL